MVNVNVIVIFNKALMLRSIRYALTDSWFASKANFEFILKKGKYFISALKDNRLVALTEIAITPTKL